MKVLRKNRTRALVLLSYLSIFGLWGVIFKANEKKINEISSDITIEYFIKLQKSLLNLRV
jgi:hypothetical protein